MTIKDKLLKSIKDRKSSTISNNTYIHWADDNAQLFLNDSIIAQYFNNVWYVLVDSGNTDSLLNDRLNAISSETNIHSKFDSAGNFMLACAYMNENLETQYDWYEIDRDVWYRKDGKKIVSE